MENSETRSMTLEMNHNAKMRFLRPRDKCHVIKIT